MDKLVAENELLVDELFHLKNYVSLATYDPKNVLNNRHTEKYISFKESNKLSLLEEDHGRRHRTRGGEEDSLQARLEANLDTTLNLLLTPEDNKGSKRKRTITNGKKRTVATSKKQKIDPTPKQNEELKTKRRGQKANGVKEEDYISSPTEMEQVEEIKPKAGRPPRKTSRLPKKITLKVTVKPPVVTHPSHISKSEFSSMDELFNSYNNILEDPAPEIPSSEFPAYLDSQQILVNKIKKGLEDELFILDVKENIFRNVPPNVKEPTMIKRNPHYTIGHYKPATNPFRLKNDLTHYDHLLAQGMKSSKLIKDQRTQHIQRCKKIAQMVEAHFKKLSQETERQEKEFEKRKLRLARDTAKEVKKKWLVALKAYKILEERERENERVVKSKEQLSKILDHSTKVLGAQMKNKASSIEPVSNESNESSAFDDDSDVNLSSSSDEEDNKEVALDETIDSELTVEQLKEKYKKLNAIKLNNDQKLSTLSDLYEIETPKPALVSIVDQLTEEERQTLVDNESKDPLLSESEGSISETSSISDESSSDYLSSDDDHHGADDINSHSNGTPTLSSLYGKKNAAESDDEEKDNIYNEAPDNESVTVLSKQLDSVDEGIPDVPIPVLLKGVLRPYQKQGLNWLASLYNNGTNGILADEMGLGKTIQTISLLSYIACEHNDWGPHLIVVPTSVMLNWEMEFKRFAPGFKVLTYYGSPQQRKEKRKGWNTPDTFHVCITSYQLVVHDQPIFRRKKWKYLILDEAHNIKNFRSQRWKSLLNFNTEHRLLLTGTPLQNNIIELWSLLYFLMPSSTAEGGAAMPDGFADLMDFQQWFGRPVDKIIQAGTDAFSGDKETKETVNKLHQVLRPYLLRRLKQDVEKQMPGKYEHIVYCRLSKRQRLLYDDFMSRAQTKETLASGNFLSIINCLMQLRKVCNHPDLFEVRPILTSFAQEKSVLSDFRINEITTRKAIKGNTSSWEKIVDLNTVNLLPAANNQLKTYHMDTMKAKSSSEFFKSQEVQLAKELEGKSIEPNYNDLEKYYDFVLNKEKKDLMDEISHRRYLNDLNINKEPLIPANTIKMLDILNIDQQKQDQLTDLNLIKPLKSRALSMRGTIEKYSFVTPKVVCKDIPNLLIPADLQQDLIHDSQENVIENPFHQSQVKASIAFPDKSLLQYDCGKLQKLSLLLHEIIPQGHRVLIFTQMSKVLDILEQFLNYNGYTYMRLDGATKIEDRQLLTERFNNDTRVKCFILSSRAGGLGINLTGADTVVFYDSDWNPAMDKQCQDRCHRIGQTRDVHIYRFVSEYTIESNILKKAEQKRHLDNVVIQEGGFTTDYFSRLTVHDMLGDENNEDSNDNENIKLGSSDFTKALEGAEDVEDANAAKLAMTEVNVDTEDFTEDAANGNSAMNTPTPSAMDGEENDTAQSEALARKIEERNHLHTNNKELRDDEKTAHNNNDDDDDDDNDEYDDEYDDDVGHIDEYMIRFIAGGFSDLL